MGIGRVSNNSCGFVTVPGLVYETNNDINANTGTDLYVFFRIHLPQTWVKISIILKVYILTYVTLMLQLHTKWIFYSNVKHHFMALKLVTNLNGCHSPTVGQKYKSR